MEEISSENMENYQCKAEKAIFRQHRRHQLTKIKNTANQEYIRFAIMFTSLSLLLHIPWNHVNFYKVFKFPEKKKFEEN